VSEAASDLCFVEEAVANYVAVRVMGVSLDEMQRWAPQDPGKLQLARRMLVSGPPIDQLLRGRVTYEDLVRLSRELGLIPKA